MPQLKAQIRSTVVDGQLKRNRKDIIAAVRAFEGQEVTVTIEKAKKKRSTEQNRFYHGVVVKLIQSAINEATGDYWGQETVHDFLREKFLKSEWHIGDGIIETRTKSTTELSTLEFCDYTEECRQWALDNLGIEIPEPNTQVEFQYT